MFDDRSEQEPEEYDPEAEFADPDSDSLTIPEVSVPEVESTESDPDSTPIPAVSIPEVSASETDAPPELLRTFWILVLVVNAAVFAVSLGAMLLYFRGDVANGGALLAGGVVLSGLAARRYRNYRAGDFATADDRDADESGSSTGDRAASTTDTDSEP